MNKLIKEIKEKAIEYGSIPFWSWNDRLCPDEIRRQIRNMSDMEMRGFFMHARGGLETEYLSEEWYDCIKICIDEAKALGMEAWSYDENGWPSGFAGGKLLDDPDNFAVFVDGEFYSEYPEANENTLSIYAFDGKGTPFAADNAVDGCERYLKVDIGFDGSYVDTMREDVVAKFIEATHEDYKRRLGEDFGKTMPGFFTDEPQYYRWKTPFSRKMDQWFLEKYGYSVLEALPALFCDYEGAEKHRYDYHKVTFEQFTKSFSKQIYDWADANRIKITGHFVEEQTLAGQMMCCGDIMPQYLYEHIPGMDYLGRRQQTDVAPKQLGSVCAQTGRKKALSEMFACCGWDVSPRELKRIAELQYAGGVNVMCQHLYPYSIRGQRKRDYPAFYSEHNLWQREMKSFDRYFNNLGYMLSLGEEYAETLVVHPMHSAWLYFQRVRMKECIADLDESLKSLTYLLSGGLIPYHFGSEYIMADMSCVKGDRLKVGLCEYKTVIIPACDTLDSTTVKLLREFSANGGRIYRYTDRTPTRIDGMPDERRELDFLRECPDITDPSVLAAIKSEGEVSVSLVEEVEPTDLRMMVRKTEYGRLIYVTNLSDKEIYGVRARVRNCASLSRLDISTLELSPVRVTLTGGDCVAELDLMGYESVVLCELEGAMCENEIMVSRRPRISFNKPFTLVDAPNNMMTLDRARLSLDGGEYSPLMPLERIRDELLSSRFKGKATLLFPFDVTDIPQRLEVIVEPVRVIDMKVNGVTVAMGEDHAIDRSFRVTDIAGHVVRGENRVELTLDYYQSDYVYYVLYGGVSETLRNCLVFDTEIEAIYLRGDFALDMRAESFSAEPNNAYRYDPEKGMSLIKQRSELDICNIVTDGYPFYCGEISFSTTLTYSKGDPTVIRIGGRYSTVRVTVNGREAGTFLFSSYLDIAEYLTEGENLIVFTLCNSYRNLLGPHHCIEAEPLSVSPKTFSFESKWKDGRCEQFDPRYSFVRFGLDI